MADPTSSGVALGPQTMSPELPGATNYYRWIAEVIDPYVGDLVLDVGSGYGAHLEHLLRPERRIVSLDVSPESVDLVRERFAGRAAVEAICGDLRSPEMRRELAGRGFDTVVALNVLEHIEDDVATLGAMREVLAGRRGHVVLQVPAHRWLYGRLDEVAGHVRRYTAASIRAALVTAGLAVVRIEHFNRFGVLPWWINGRLLRQRVESRMVGTQVRLFDRYLIPLARLVDRVAPLPIGQSLIAIALGEESPC